MPCYHPLEAWRGRELTRNGKRPLVFDPGAAMWPDRVMRIGCGQCVGCRLDRSRQWAVRCVHEAQMHPDNAFITLTFDDENLWRRENPWSIDTGEWQRFMKRLRKAISPRKVKYYACGEYGETYGRPHYHACLFGWTPPDKRLWKARQAPDGQVVRLYRSEMLEKLWPYGYSTVGDVTFESAAYVARYVMKKVTGDAADSHYLVVDRETGELLGFRQPERTWMSLNPAIGKEWFEKYYSDVFPHDEVVIRGKPQKVPKYYEKVYENLDVDKAYELELIREQRVEKMRTTVGEESFKRLEDKEKFKRRQIERLIRPLEV